MYNGITMTEFQIAESAELSESAGDSATGKRWRAVLIKSGWGSKAYYTEEALKRDGPEVFKAGTPIFLDHQTPNERDAKPFGSVQNFAGELATDAVWDAEEGGLVAEVEIFEHEQARVRSLAKRVGLSIRATTTAERGSMEGRSGRIVTGLLGARSVDLVVRAGAKGQLLEVLESDEEMEEQQMNEALEAINALAETVNKRFDGIDGKIKDIEESLTAEAEVEVEVESQEETAPALTEESVTALIAAEIAKIPTATVVVAESASLEGNEETDEVEESATELYTPKHWAVVKENS